MKKLTTLLLASMLTCGCVSHATPTYNKHQATQVSTTKMALIHQATGIQMDLSQGNFKNIAKHIHPTKGVQFSMYAYVDGKKDKRFSRQQFLTYLKKSRIKFTWGEMDGSGDLHITTLPNYLSKWIQAERFDNGSIAINKFKGSGNSLNNLREVYPNADRNSIVEFYDKGREEYEGMDWRAMRLVFEDYQGRSYLVAIVTDMWTI